MKRKFLAILSFSTAIFSLAKFGWQQGLQMEYFKRKIFLVSSRSNLPIQQIAGSSSSDTQSAFLKMYRALLLFERMIPKFDFQNYQFCSPPWKDYVDLNLGSS